MSAALAMLIRPLLSFVVFACILLPIRYAMIWWFPEGKVKRFLLTEIKQSKRTARL